MKLDKGSYFSIEGIYYVLVYPYIKDGTISLCCICDNANNSYIWNPEDIDKEIPNRPLPLGVIIEVLRGQHDDRFDHLIEE